MDCAVRRALLNEYQEATTRLFESSGKLAKAAGSYEIDAWEKAWDTCEEARRRCTDLRLQIDEHVRTHCGQKPQGSLRNRAAR